MKTNVRGSLLQSCLLAAALLALPAAVQAQFTYITNNGTITITGYTGSGAAAVIPATLNGLPVTSLGDYSFFYNLSVASITIPDSVATIGTYTVYSCNYLTNVVIGNGVVNIGDHAFDYCVNLATVTIPNSVTSIGPQAFEGCGLTSIAIPDSVTNIGDRAFSDCDDLTNFSIGSGVISFGAEVFSYCRSLTAINVDAANSGYASMTGVMFDKSLTTIMQYPARKVGSIYTIPNNVTIIGNYAFSQCNLTSVIIPGSVTNIGWGAFQQSLGLTSVYFAGNAPAADGSVFAIRLGMSHTLYNATAYYLQGTTGWNNFSANTGLPTALWLPQVQTGDGSFGVRTNQFGFNINWASGQTVVVEACTNLSNPNWIPVSTNTLISSAFHFSDPQPANLPARFYRLSSQ